MPRIIFNSFLDLSLELLSASPEQSPLIGDYFEILIYGAPAILASFSMMGWLFGMQNAHYPLFVTITINIVNIVLSYYLVKEVGWGIAGAAYGTVLAQYLGMVLLGLLIIIRYPWLKSIKWESRGGWTTFAKSNFDLFIRTVALTFAFGFFYRQSSQSGHLILAANVVLLQFLSWMSYGIDGFAYAAESLVGKYHGEGNVNAVKKAIHKIFQWGIVIAAIFLLTYLLGFDLIASVFTKDSKVLDIVGHYKIWIAFLPMGAFVCYMWDGIFIGLMMTKYMRNSMLISIGIYIGYYELIRGSTDNAIWYSFILFLCVRGLVQYIYWRSHITKSLCS